MTRILIVDDDRSVREAIRTYLEWEGFDVVAAANGSEGVGALDRASFDLMLLDMFMPGMDGLQAIEAIRDKAPMTPIIAMSGYMLVSGSDRAPEFLNMSAKIGSDYVLAKPFGPQALMHVVRQCLDGARRRARNDG